jgi:hypothetical protein
MTDVSLCVSSYRPGFNMLIESLKHLEFDGSWECIFADEIYDQRRKAVEEHKGDLPLKHVPAEPYEYSCPASTMNSSIRPARGELVLIVGDHSIYAPDYLQKHWDAYKDLTDATLVSSYIDLEAPEIKENPKIDDCSIFKEEFDIKKFLERPAVHAEERHNFVHNWADTQRGYLTGEFTQGLIGIPRELMVRINGFHEGVESGYDGGKGFSDFDVVHRASLLGWRFILDTSLRVYRCAHPHKKIEDLKYPFTEKKTYRTREENKRRLMNKMQRLSRKLTLVNSHKGLRDLEWVNSKRIMVQGGGAEVCTRKWVSILQHQGIPILHNESFGKFTFTDVSTIIVYGVSPFDFLWTEPYRDKIKIYFWFVGTDAYNLINGTFGIDIPKHENYRFLAIGERVQRELKSVGIESEILMDYEDDITAHWDELDEMDFYKRDDGLFNISIYIPSERREFYHYDLMKEVAKVFEGDDNIRFHFFGNVDPHDDLPSNCIDWGYVTGEEKKRLYQQTDIYLRSTDHDGEPMSNIEFHKLAKSVICDYPYKHCHVAVTEDEIISKIRELRDDYKPNYEAQKYYRERFNKQRFINEFVRIFYGEDCLQKWLGN